MQLGLSFNILKKSASNSSEGPFGGILNIALHANSLKSPFTPWFVTFLWPSTPYHVILDFCQHHLFQTHCIIVLSDKP